MNNLSSLAQAWSDEPGLPQIHIVLLALFALLTFVAFVSWLIAWRLARQARVNHRALQMQTALMHQLVSRPEPEDPHRALCRALAQLTGQKIDALTLLSGSADPLYLLFREDNTRRRLLLAGAGQRKAALRAIKAHQRILRKQRWVVKPSNDLRASAFETIAAAWIVLAPDLDLSTEAPIAQAWEIVMLPPEEIA